MQRAERPLLVRPAGAVPAIPKRMACGVVRGLQPSPLSRNLVPPPPPPPPPHPPAARSGGQVIDRLHELGLQYSEQQAAAIFVQVAEAVAHLHEYNVLHR